MLNDVRIIEFSPEYAEAAKDLLVELQTHISASDKFGIVVMKDDFRNAYFEFLTAEIKKQSGKIFLALKGNRAVGLIACKIFQGGGEADITTVCPKIGFISDLIVTESERGRGIGKMLLERTERYFNDCGCDYAQLEVSARNTVAAELYDKAGYEPYCVYMIKKRR